MMFQTLTTHNMDEQEIRRIIRDELSFMIKTNKLIFDKPIQILDGNDITLGGVQTLSLGTRFGTSASQKLAFYGATPLVKQTGALRNIGADPTSDPVGYDQYARAGVADINYVLTQLGLATA